ncbi:MAG TPA: PDZ domain-containing protein [Rhodocyclaceae bacterium]|nr:PDZ domain-containing protein [Rhodocyclaceae bacterium]
MTTPVRYTITPHRPQAHLFRVTCTVDDPDPAGQVFRLPAWIPGSYMIREFSRNIVALEAECDGAPVAVDKLDKHTWRATVPSGARRLTVSCEVYAWDLSVRSAHLDQTHGFFNGTSVFLAVAGREHLPCIVDIRPPEGIAFRDWQVATTLAPAHGEFGAARALGFGSYRAEDYDELVDHPVEMGRFTHAAFDAGSVRHEIAITGRHDCDVERLCADLAKICAWQLELFGAPAPVERYLFLATIVGDGYGGLEHRASTALLASRNDLPHAGMSTLSDGYKTFLGLCSHEYFHTWNVKRITPAAFIPYDLGRENYTRLLWAFEGFTSYYDDLALVRSGVISLEDYLDLLGKTIGNVLRGSGRLRQSVAESSFDAWTKYYRQDENAPNAIVSYYAKGALIALALDLQLRAGTQGRVSLDDVMRALWQRHGQTGRGVGEDDIFALVGEIAEAAGRVRARRLAGWLREAVSGTGDLPLARLLEPFGVDFRLDTAGAAPTLGVKLAAGNGEAKLANVFDGGAAQTAGLSAGDVLVAVDGLRVTAGNLDAMLARRRVGERVEVHAFRRDELMCFAVELDPPRAEVAKLSLRPRLSAKARALRKGWLGA